MRIHADCVPCLMKRILFQSRLVDGVDDFFPVQAALNAFSANMVPDRKSVSIATEVHRACYEKLPTDDPYWDLKVEADEVAGRFVDEAMEYVRKSDDKLRAAMSVAVVGNIMDFGSGIAIDSPEEFTGIFWDMVRQGFDVDDIDEIRKILDESSSVVYMFDNCGESQLDKVLIRYLRSQGKEVIGVARGAPILNDVTVRDAERSGLDKELDRLLTTGKFYIGLDWDDVPPDLMDAIDNSGLIIAKGMANYESLSDEDLPVPIVHLLRAKCEPVARCIGARVGQNVAKLRR